MDLFNRKRVKELKKEIINYKIAQKGHLDIINKLTDKTKNDYKAANERIHEAEKISNQILDQNRKLIKWIENILKEFGTVEARENHVTIPIYKRERCTYYEGIDKETFLNREYIEIPSITLVKIR